MNVMMQRHAAKYIYIVPDGLRELMSDISREVLRSQPKDVYTFIADYLEALLITRENARVAARLVQSITDITTTTCEFLEATGMRRAEADKIVSIIQKTFKKHVQEQESFAFDRLSEEVEEVNIISDIIDEAKISPEKGEQAAIIIQHAYQNFKRRKQKEKELLSGIIDWRVAARSAIKLYRRTGVTNEEANRAATLIKKAYKGYYTRQMIKKLNVENRNLYEEKEPEVIETGPEETEESVASEEIEQDQQEPKLSDSKCVKINYDTVIPHVNFGDVDYAVKETEETSQSKERTTERTSTTSAVISSALQSILDSAFDRATDAVTVAELLEETDMITPLEPQEPESDMQETESQPPIEASDGGSIEGE
ncbi:uncharacterized protein [Leptinotarsa decemlineata]|uniref:uncharacterized protein n=1 Tax=Leptinotarsa decemlineata TaxID=7539 RepID=UPI003D308F13